MTDTALIVPGFYELRITATVDDNPGESQFIMFNVTLISPDPCEAATIHPVSIGPLEYTVGTFSLFTLPEFAISESGCNVTYAVEFYNLYGPDPTRLSGVTWSFTDVEMKFEY